MRRKLYWHSQTASSQDAEFLDASMRDLLGGLGSIVSSLDIVGERLDPSLTPLALEHLNIGYLDGCLKAMQAECDVSDAQSLPGLIVYCQADHPAAKAARVRLRHAYWGINIAGALSLVYVAANKHAIWHEALHLIGAQDHYDVATLAQTCELKSCIMQYAPGEETVGNHPMFCRRTLAILRNSAT